MFRLSKLSFIAFFATFLITPNLLQAQTQEIKFSVLAPEGSTWTKTMKEWDNELRSLSGGKLGLKLYAGGVSGDEKDVLRKMRIGQVHAAGFTGVGLGQIVSDIRVMELPLLFNSDAQADKIQRLITPEIDKKFEAKGYKVLGEAPIGFVYLFSNKKPIAKKSDMEGVKLWVWEGDPLAKAMCDAFGIKPIPLAITDVLTSLQTGLIDAVYSTPMGMIALQWFTKVKHMTNFRLTYGTGAMLITLKRFNQLPADQQKLLVDTSKKYANLLTQRIRSENQQALGVLRKSGINFVEVDSGVRQEIKTTAETIYPKLVNKLYPSALLQKVKGAL